MIEDRRRFLLSGALTLAGLGGSAARAAPDAGIPAASALARAASSPIDLEPRILQGTDQAGGLARLSFGGSSPRVLRLRRGVAAPIRIVNRLDEPIRLDWHGMRMQAGLDPAAAGGHDVIAPGADRNLVLVPPDSGTFWVHPGILPGVPDQTARGLAGVVIVEEPDAPEVDLDALVLLSDNKPDAPDLADRLFVNRKAWPFETTLAPGSRLRLRIVNGSTREALAATTFGARPFVVAIDGQPSELFRPLNDTVPIGPGARFDLIVDLPRSAGAEVKLTLEGAGPPASKPNRPAFVARAVGEPRAERPPIRALPPNPALPLSIPLEHSLRAEIAVGARPAAKPGDPARWSVNAVEEAGLAKAPLFRARRSSSVTLTLVNRSAELTAFRLQGHVMRLLHAKDDGWEPYWRDSVIVPPGATAHVAFVADNPGRWLIESPFFDQAAHGLACWFEVT